MILEMFTLFCYKFGVNIVFHKQASQSHGSIQRCTLVRMSSRKSDWLDNLYLIGYNKQQCQGKHQLTPDKQAAERVGRKFPEEVEG